MIQVCVAFRKQVLNLVVHSWTKFESVTGCSELILLLVLYSVASCGSPGSSTIPPFVVSVPQFFLVFSSVTTPIFIHLPFASF